MLVLGLFWVGCAPPNAPVPSDQPVAPKGRLVKNGVPIQPAGRNRAPGDAGMRVLFVPLGGTGAGKAISANILSDSSGAFELVGQDARPIPAGRYRIAIHLGPEGGRDELEGKYGSENSPIEVEVKEGEDLVIDLAKYQ